MPLLLPHAFAVRSGSDLLLMDIRADAYSLIPDAFAGNGTADETLHPLGSCIRIDVADALREAGLVVAGTGEPSMPLLAPTMRHRSTPGTWRRPALRDMLYLAIVVLRGRQRLRRGLPCRSYRRARSSPAASIDALDHALMRLASARLFVPCPSRCLPSSMVTSFFLAKHGIASEIVFGVRTHPFAAHCWVEVGGVLVDDEPDRVRAYQPICVADA